MNSNVPWLRAIREARSDYIALLDGDDYWTSPHKLQKQVDFLDQHSECAICFHNVLIAYDDGSVPPHPSNPPDQKTISEMEDLFERCFIETCSVMFRAGLVSRIPDWFASDPSGDWSLHVLNAQHGKIGYIDEVMGVYRQHAGGFWSSLSAIEQHRRVARFYEDWLRRVEPRHRPQLRRQLSRWYHDLALVHQREENRGEARRFLARSLLTAPFNARIPWRERLDAWRSVLRGDVNRR
jgi:hypothetical protein